jgi:hypothetical protein
MSYSLYIYKKTYVDKNKVSIPGLNFFNNNDDDHLIISETIFDFHGWDFSERAIHIIEDETRQEVVQSEVLELYKAYCEVKGLEVDQSIISKIEESQMGFGDGECFFECFQSY